MTGCSGTGEVRFAFGYRCCADIEPSGLLAQGARRRG
jgi:hypothetical protein